MRKLIYVAAVAAASLMAMAGSAVPVSAVSASAQLATTVAGKVTYQSATVATLTVTSSTGCEAIIHLNVGLNADGFERVEAVIGQNSCGWPVEAGVTCSGRLGSPNIWGQSVEGVGGESFAPCNSTFPDFDHGGARVDVVGTWYYWTYIFPKP